MGCELQREVQELLKCVSRMWSAQVVFTCTSVAEKVVNWEEVIELCIGMEIVARGRGGFVAAEMVCGRSCIATLDILVILVPVYIVMH